MPRVEITTADGLHKFELSYNLRGNGQRRVLLVMGLHTPGEAWDVNVLPLLEADPTLQICTYDNRGCGSSGMPEVSRFTTLDMAVDAIELLNHLGWTQVRSHERMMLITQHVHIVGVSLGGMIATELALLLPPERIASLTLAVTHTGGLGKIPPWDGGKQALFQTPQDSSVELMRVLFTPEFLASPAPPAEQSRYPTMMDFCLARHLERCQRLGPAKGASQQIAAVATHSVSNERLAMLRDSGIATMVLGAADDKVPTLRSIAALSEYHTCLEEILSALLRKLIRPSCSAQIAEVLRPQEFIVFPGCGHAINMEKLADFNAAVLRHWKRNARGEGTQPTNP